MRQISRLLRRPYSPASCVDEAKSCEEKEMEVGEFRPSTRHRDARIHKVDGGPCNCVKVMDSGTRLLISSSATLHIKVDLEVKKAHVLLWFLGALEHNLLTQSSLRRTARTLPGHIFLEGVNEGLVLYDSVKQNEDQQRHNCTVHPSHSAFAGLSQILGTCLSSTPPTSTTTSLYVGFLVYFVAFLTKSVVLKMPHSFGYRARTRHMFKRGFKGAKSISIERRL